jgi:hypothetical protein
MFGTSVTKGRIELTETLATSPAAAPGQRPTVVAFLHALPAIALMTLILWAFTLATAYSVSMFIDLELIGLAIVLLLLVPPAAWANWHAARLSIDAERDVNA